MVLSGNSNLPPTQDEETKEKDKREKWSMVGGSGEVGMRLGERGSSAIQWCIEML